jgi:hypothetical protein
MARRRTAVEDAVFDRSLWCTQPGGGTRLAIAASRAASARSASMRRLRAQPTTRRDQASRITARWTKPLRRRM